MKKLVLVLGIVLLVAACDNDSMENETNPYPDGVYPFEVTGVSHNVTYDLYKGEYYCSITWTTLADVTSVDLEMFIVSTSGYEKKVYSYDPKDPPFLSFEYRDFVLKKDSFSFYTQNDSHYIIIKCVDKFKNISNGIKYDFSVVPAP